MAYDTYYGINKTTLSRRDSILDFEVMSQLNDLGDRPAEVLKQLIKKWAIPELFFNYFRRFNTVLTIGDSK